MKNSEARKRAAVTSGHVPTTADVKAAYCVAGMFTGNYATAYLDGLSRFGPEFDAWLAGTAASNPTDPEPTGTLEGAPGADSGALAASQRVETNALVDFITVHTAGHFAPEFCTVDCLARAVLGSSWLVDHDRQIAAVAWDDGYQDGRRQDAEGNDGPRFVNPYSEEARRG